MLHAAPGVPHIGQLGLGRLPLRKHPHLRRIVRHAVHLLYEHSPDHPVVLEGARSHIDGRRLQDPQVFGFLKQLQRPRREPRRHDEAGGVDGVFRGRAVELAHGGNAIAPNSDVGSNSRRARTVQYLAAANQHIKGWGLCRNGGRLRAGRFGAQGRGRENDENP